MLRFVTPINNTFIRNFTNLLSISDQKSGQYKVYFRQETVLIRYQVEI